MELTKIQVLCNPSTTNKLMKKQGRGNHWVFLQV